MFDAITAIFLIRDPEVKERYRYLSKALAVGIYADSIVHEREVSEAEAVAEELAENPRHAKYILARTKALIKKYMRSKNAFDNDRFEVVNLVIERIDEDMEKLIFRIFKADGVIARREQEIIDNLEEFFEYRRTMAEKIRRRMSEAP